MSAFDCITQEQHWPDHHGLAGATTAGEVRAVALEHRPHEFSRLPDAEHGFCDVCFSETRLAPWGCQECPIKLCETCMTFLLIENSEGLTLS
jgi:hypothetical protein